MTEATRIPIDGPQTLEAQFRAALGADHEDQAFLVEQFADTLRAIDHANNRVPVADGLD